MKLMQIQMGDCREGVTTLEEVLRVVPLSLFVVRCSACDCEILPAFLFCPFCSAKAANRLALKSRKRSLIGRGEIRLDLCSSLRISRSSCSRFSSLQDLSVTYEGHSEDVATRPPDISTRGMFITTKNFPVGAVLTVSFKLAPFRREISTRAEVRYCLAGLDWVRTSLRFRRSL